MAIELRFTESGPKLTPDEIEAFEQEIHGQLPDDYKQFLLKCNGGFTEPPVGIRWREEIDEVPYFVPLLADPRRGVRRGLSDLREFDVEGFLRIASTMDEQDICLDFRDKVGAVWLAVYSYENDVAVEATMRPFAKSFTAFMNKLIEIEVPYCRIEDLGKNGTIEELEEYLAEGNLIDAVGKNDLTILCESIKFSNLAMMEACIERGAGLAESVHMAVIHRRIDLVKRLIVAGADINEQDKHGDRPIAYVLGTALPGEEGARNRELKAALIEFGAVDEIQE